MEQTDTTSATLYLIFIPDVERIPQSQRMVQ